MNRDPFLDRSKGSILFVDDDRTSLQHVHFLFLSGTYTITHYYNIEELFLLWQSSL